MSATNITSVNQVPSAGKLTVLSLQHVLAFYAGAVVVPLVIAGALDLDTATTIHLINADLFTCGIATILQSVGFWKVGVRLPLIQGVTFTAVSPIIAIGLAAGGGTTGLPYIYGSIIIAGLFTFFAAPFFARLIKFFPPVVTGTVLTVMGVTLISVSAGDIAGFDPNLAPDAKNIAYALGTLAVIILAQRFFKGFMSTITVLLGLVIGTTVAFFMGDASFGGVQEAAWVGVTTPFYFGIPRFSLMGAISMIIVMLITMVETTGDVFATGEIVGERITSEHIKAALRADGLSTLLGGVLNSFPYTCFAQNVGLVRLTRVHSRWVVAAAGGIMIVLGLLPKAGAIVASIPHAVLGGASIAMFANVAIVGIQTLSRVNMREDRNAVIVSTSLGLAMLVTLRPGIAGVLPDWATILFASGITVGSLAAIFLNIIFNHLPSLRSQNIVRDSKGVPVTVEELNKLPRAAAVAALAPLINQATWPVARAVEGGSFLDSRDVLQRVQQSLASASTEEKEALIREYPDLAALIGARVVEEPLVTKDRGSLALGDITETQKTEIIELCDSYQRKFGYPLVVFLTTADSVKEMALRAARRMENDPAIELSTSIDEIAAITADRYEEIMADADPIGSSWVRSFDALD
ncbi:solute carrier family 23 protein [Boudabousia marimammalium]|uniref:Uracil-xanthine permease n=1 Tax=Boudabousia marimammalium TaxID=156892 RepID=A0A1Q5PR79_9ACTO|nr:solute carrier family 23 protein [Boudabousia marimammalium]OKL49989.1 uracil-xanthine permease [Boudabousia marimammalium]